MADEHSTIPIPLESPAWAPAARDELPPGNTRRWVPRRKAAVVNAVREGRITLEQVCERYELSEEEFGSWERLIERHGLKGLRTTRTKEFRKPILPPTDRVMVGR